MAFPAIHRLPGEQTQAAPIRLRETVTVLFERWKAGMRERRTFSQFNERDLHDCGLLQWDVERELARHFWDL